MTPKDILSQLRANDGHTIRALQDLLGTKIPESRVRTKGKRGTLIEKLLRCDVGSRAGLDFEEIGLELKVVPVDDSGKPWETTAITQISYINIPSWRWEESRAYHKTRLILFAPMIKTMKKIPIQDRVLKNPFLWSPSSEQDMQLKEDRELVAKLVREGKASHLSGRMGIYMQPRTKGRDAQDLVDAPSPRGGVIRVKRRTFYFRVSFIGPIIKKSFGNSRGIAFKQDILM